MSDVVQIVEVSPRDGLQNEPETVTLEDKLQLIENLSAAGCTVIEATSFVSPKWVPQMGDHLDLVQRLNFDAGVRYPVLVPNMRGLDNVLNTPVKEIAVFAAASNSFSQKNINCTIAQSIENFQEVITKAKAANLKVRGYVSCVLGCPYEGPIEQKAVIEVALALYQAGCYEISLGDTIGVGTPKKAAQLIQALSREMPLEHIAAHFHDTYGQALANLYACLEQGVRVIDSSVAGLGGCPYAKGASGNVATEDVVYLLEGLGLQTGIDLDKLIHAGFDICSRLNRRNHSKVAQAKGLN